MVRYLSLLFITCLGFMLFDWGFGCLIGSNRIQSVDVFGPIAIEKERLLTSILPEDVSDIDTIFLGSSQTQFGISPAHFDKEFEGKSINLGVGGYVGTGYAYQMLRHALENYKLQPKRVFYSPKISTLSDKEPYLQKIFLQTRPYIERLLKDRNTQTQLLLKSNIFSLGHKYTLKELFEKAATPLSHKAMLNTQINTKEYDYPHIGSYSSYTLHKNGWIEGHGYLNPIVGRGLDRKKFSPNKESILYLEKISALCKENDIELIIAPTPKYINLLAKKNQDNQAFYSFMEKNKDLIGYTFLFLNTPVRFPLNDKKQFFDANHLNSYGAALFSQRLAVALKQKEFFGYEETQYQDEGAIQEGQLVFEQIQNNEKVYIKKIYLSSIRESLPYANIVACEYGWRAFYNRAAMAVNEEGSLGQDTFFNCSKESQTTHAFQFEFDGHFDPAQERFVMKLILFLNNKEEGVAVYFRSNDSKDKTLLFTIDTLTPGYNHIEKTVQLPAPQ